MHRLIERHPGRPSEWSTPDLRTLHARGLPEQLQPVQRALLQLLRSERLPARSGTVDAHVNVHEVVPHAHALDRSDVLS